MIPGRGPRALGGTHRHTAAEDASRNSLSESAARRGWTHRKNCRGLMGTWGPEVDFLSPPQFDPRMNLAWPVLGLRQQAHSRGERRSSSFQILSMHFVVGGKGVDGCHLFPLPVSPRSESADGCPDDCSASLGALGGWLSRPCRPQDTRGDLELLQAEHKARNRDDVDRSQASPRRWQLPVSHLSF